MHFERCIMFFLNLGGKSDLTRDPSINARGRDLTSLTPYKLVPARFQALGPTGPIERIESCRCQQIWPLLVRTQAGPP